MSNQKRRFPRTGGALLLAASLAAAGISPLLAAGEPAIELSVSKSFAAALDLDPIRLAAVQDGGRLKTVDSLAREKLKYVNSSRAMRKLDPVLVFLDLMLVPEHYAGTNIVYIRKKPFRQQLVQKIRSVTSRDERTGPISDPELDRIEETGFVSLMFLDHPVVRDVLSELQRDLMRANKEVQKLEDARALADARVLRSIFRVIPPPGGTPLDPWYSIDAIERPQMPDIPAHAGMRSGGGVPGLPEEVAAKLREAWTGLAEAWRFQDAAKANESIRTLAETLASVEPSLYPSERRRAWEHWYYRNNKLTQTWILYFLALPFLLMATAYGFRWARAVGLLLFVAAFLLHTLSIGLRWYLAGRIPNANMFEAITASAWFGGAAALVMELVLRRWPVKNLPALGASAYAMTAMMVANFMPVALDSDIGVLMPVLDRTIWLYIHTNIVIASYALIFFAAVTALLYLGLRFAMTFSTSSRLREVWAGSGGSATVAVEGGAASLILGRRIRPGEALNVGLAKSLDGATMIFLEVAFLALWVGTILGAVWADVSWGRPWGWDPKEVFALNTWIVFLILLHVRLKVKDKAFWTAILAIVGCAVMLFNWIAVNFVIVGLHSYA
ncbi:MAG: hypothetical protein D6718_09735 [Acidobacteria bacterium]|nr:MAG: hypothetical protein D6718_09735 [Acidobacteriota bacterium]